MTHRVHVLLDDDRYSKVLHVARSRGKSMSAVIRDAIDRLPADLPERRAAMEALLAMEPVQLPEDPGDLRRELDEARGRFRH